MGQKARRENGPSPKDKMGLLNPVSCLVCGTKTGLQEGLPADPREISQYDSSYDFAELCNISST